MTALQIIEKTGNEAVQKLRLQKLRSGRPFMINSKDLESNQCYLEYPDGSIQLVFLENAAKEFTMIRTLSPSEELALRSRFGLSRL
jgi:hydrogenase maturation factor HypF (carbamoyltransferase family)